MSKTQNALIGFAVGDAMGVPLEFLDRQDLMKNPVTEMLQKKPYPVGIYSDDMGKVKGSDIKEFKQTILYSHIMTTPYKDELLKYYGKEVNDEKLEEVRELFKKSKSYDYSVDLMNKLYDESLSILDNITWISNDKKDILRGFVEYLKIRNK